MLKTNKDFMFVLFNHILIVISMTILGIWFYMVTIDRIKDISEIQQGKILTEKVFDGDKNAVP